MTVEVFPRLEPWPRIGGGTDPVSRLVTDGGRIFRYADGTPWRWKGTSAFKLAEVYRRQGEKGVRPFVKYYTDQQVSVFRVWRYVMWSDGWGTSDEVVSEFLHYMAYLGTWVELTLLTDPDPARVGPAKALIERLTDERHPNLFGETANEPPVNGIDTSPFKDLWARSGYHHTSGDYELNGADHYGTYLATHDPRDSEWPRKSKNHREFYDGTGPDIVDLAGAKRMPIIGDEPARRDYGPDFADPMDAYCYAANAGIHGGGATCHSTTGKYAEIPPFRSEEDIWIRKFCEGLSVYPEDAPSGRYDRINEGSDTLRTYIADPYLCRVRPKTPGPVGAYRTPLDSYGVAWRR